MPSDLVLFMSLQKSVLSGSGLLGRLLRRASGQLESHTSMKEAWFTFIEFDEPQASLGLSWDTGKNSLITVNPQRGPLQDYTMKKKENESPGCTLQGRGHDGKYSLGALLQGLCLEGPCSITARHHRTSEQCQLWPLTCTAVGSSMECRGLGSTPMALLGSLWGREETRVSGHARAGEAWLLVLCGP